MRSIQPDDNIIPKDIIEETEEEEMNKIENRIKEVKNEI